MGAVSRRWMWMAAVAAVAVAVLGCEPGRLASHPEQEPPEDAPAEPGFQRYELRLVGEGPADYQHAQLRLRSLEVKAGDRALAFQRSPTASWMDLAKTEQAYLLGNVRWPDGLEAATVELRFDRLGAYQERGVEGTVDAAGATLRFVVKQADLARRGRAVLHLRLEKSLLDKAEGKLLAPSSVLSY